MQLPDLPDVARSWGDNRCSMLVRRECTSNCHDNDACQCSDKTEGRTDTGVELVKARGPAFVHVMDIGGDRRRGRGVLVHALSVKERMRAIVSIGNGGAFKFSSVIVSSDRVHRTR